MIKFVEKGMRIKKPHYLNVQLRGEVYDYLLSLSESLGCGTSVLIRGILEDFYDQHKDSLDTSNEEVPGDD